MTGVFRRTGRKLLEKNNKGDVHRQCYQQACGLAQRSGLDLITLLARRSGCCPKTTRKPFVSVVRIGTNVFRTRREKITESV